MAKKIKFPLAMKNDVPVKDLNELRENFDLDKAVGYFLDGKLLRWLEARYYDTETDAVKNLNSNAPDFKQKLCKIFDVDFSVVGNIETDFDAVIEHNRKLTALKQYTSDPTILANVDSVAFNQEDLSYLLDEGIHEIYLCDNSFVIPLRVENKRYIGIGKVEVIINSDVEVDFASKKIDFENVYFNASYKSIISKAKVEVVKNKDFYELGKESENRKEYIEAFEYYAKASELGDNRAMLQINELYYWGRGLAQDYVKAFEWLKKAIDNGNADAYTFYSMGWRYHYGQGITQDYNKALEYYKKAADLGHIESMNLIGEIYQHYNFRLPVSDDWNLQAYKYYKKAADLGDTVAMIEIANLYLLGQYGIAKDTQKAFEWLKKAADLGNTKAMLAIAVEFYNANPFLLGIRGILQTAPMFDSAYKISSSRMPTHEGFEWLEKAIQNGSADAMFYRAAIYFAHRFNYYEYHTLCTQDMKKAIETCDDINLLVKISCFFTCNEDAYWRNAGCSRLLYQKLNDWGYEIILRSDLLTDYRAKAH